MSATIRFSILAALALWGASAFAETVEPLGSFDIKSSLPPSYASDQIAVRAFTANNSGLYFLIKVNPEHPPIAKTVILHTDSAGTREELITLPPTGLGVYGVERRYYYGINVDGSGNIYLSQSKRISRHEYENSFVVYNPQGDSTNVTTMEPNRTFCLNNGTIFYIDGVPVTQSTPVALKRLSMNQASSVAQWEAYGPLLCSPLTSSKLVVLGKIDCRIQLIDLSSGSRKTVSLAPIPAINKGIAGRDPDEIGRHTERTKFIARSVVVNDIATTGNGDIYLNVLGHHVSRGAVIVKLDQDGNLSRSLRCKLPAFDELKTQDFPGGQMIPQFIGVSDTHLFIQGDGKVARFPI